MPNNTIPSLGDESRSLKLVRESYDLPPVRKEVVGQFEKILNLGGVQKVVVQIGQPIQVDRFVSKDSLPELPEATEFDLFASARNAEMHELKGTDSLSSYECLFRAFYVISQKRLKPRALLVLSDKNLRKWLNIDDLLDVTEIFGVETKISPSIPDETALLVASKTDDKDSIEFSVVIPFSEKKNEANRRKSSEKRSS